MVANGPMRSPRYAHASCMRHRNNELSLHLWIHRYLLHCCDAMRALVAGVHRHPPRPSAHTRGTGSFEDRRTSDLVAERLAAWGWLQVHRIRAAPVSSGRCAK